MEGGVKKGESVFIASSAHVASGLSFLSREFPNETFRTVTVEEFSSNLREFVWRFRRYRRAVFYTYDFELSRTILWHGIVWWLSCRGILLDGCGRKRVASLWGLISQDIPQALAEVLLLPYVFARVDHQLRAIRRKTSPGLSLRHSITYLRTDHWFGTKAGGSVTHIAGVANSFRDFGIPLFFLSSDHLELIDESRTPVICVRPVKNIRNIRDAPQIAYNLRLISEGMKAFEQRRPTMVYQRYSQYNYAGAYLATKWNLPFVLEFNGSELWVSKHWGISLGFPRWAERIEMCNLHSADTIVVVSAALKDQLTARGIPGTKILVNPNGVDIDRFDPTTVKPESAHLREALGLNDRIVIGFIGTFGMWHGAEVLAKAVKAVVKDNSQAHFLFIGNGSTMPAVTEIIRKSGMSNRVTFTGIVPQELGPAYLGACDVLVSPHVPNTDGSPFFGSPTKLFEYMAIGRGIVASRLDQIGDILTDKETALLVTPGSVEDLSRAILVLSKDAELRRRLGENARAKVKAQYTWAIHTKRILDHLHATLE
jgi:glycosyltransferase involved in cell wall biosynthesis